MKKEKTFTEDNYFNLIGVVGESDLTEDQKEALKHISFLVRYGYNKSLMVIVDKINEDPEGDVLDLGNWCLKEMETIRQHELSDVKKWACEAFDLIEK